MRSLYIALIALCFSLVAFAEDLDSDLAKELLLEQKYQKGLTLDGTSGLLLTPSTEGLYQGAFFVSLNGFIDRTSLPGDDEADHDFGLIANVSLGVWDDVFNWGIFRNVELSLSLPMYLEDISLDDPRFGTGDAKFSVKTEWIEEDPLSPEIPAVSFILTAWLPTGFEEFKTVDSIGAEAGIILGTKIPDSSNQVLFDLYLEFRWVYLEYDGANSDSFVITNIGIAFPMIDVPNSYLMLEWLKYTSNDNGENGLEYSLGIRLKSETNNITVGFKFRDYEELSIIERKIFVSADFKW